MICFAYFYNIKLVSITNCLTGCILNEMIMKKLTESILIAGILVAGIALSSCTNQANTKNAAQQVQPVKAASDIAVLDTAWTQLFNGKDLTGWKHVGPGYMTVDSGLIKNHGGMGLLYWTGGKVGNCQIKVVWHMKDKNDNSGIFIRIPLEPREEWMPVNYGYEVQIDNDPEASGEDEYHETGMLYSLTKPLVKNAWLPGPQYNTEEITLDGPRTIVFLNGKKVTDFTEGDSVPARKFDFEPQRGRRPDFGWFGLQNHSDKDVVYFKEVEIRALKK